MFSLQQQLYDNGGGNGQQQQQQQQQQQSGVDVGVIGRPLRADAIPYDLSPQPSTQYYYGSTPVYLTTTQPHAYPQQPASMARMPSMSPLPLIMQTPPLHHSHHSHHQHHQHPQQQQLYARQVDLQHFGSYSAQRPSSHYGGYPSSTSMYRSSWDGGSNSSRFHDSASYSMRTHQYQPASRYHRMHEPPLISADGCIYQVHFKRAHRNFMLCDQAPRNILPGDFVKVEADRGEDLGVVVSKTAIEDFVEFVPTAGYRGRGYSAGQGEKKYILRMATNEERLQLRAKVEDEERALQVIREKIMERHLPMIILDAEYQFDRHKLVFFFEADRRIDFRELVSDLFSLYKTRIWMQQVDTSSIPGEEIALRLAHAAGFLPSSYMLEASRDMEELSQTVSEFAAGGTAGGGGGVSGGAGYYYEGADVAAGGLILAGGASHSPAAAPSSVRGMGPTQFLDTARLTYGSEEDRRAAQQQQSQQSQQPQVTAQQLRYVPSTAQGHGYPSPGSDRGVVHHSAFGFAAPFYLHGEEPTSEGTPRVTELDTSSRGAGPVVLGFDVERTVGPLLESPGGASTTAGSADADADADVAARAVAVSGAGSGEAYAGASEELKTFTEAA